MKNTMAPPVDNSRNACAKNVRNGKKTLETQHTISGADILCWLAFRGFPKRHPQLFTFHPSGMKKPVICADFATECWQDERSRPLDRFRTREGIRRSSASEPRFIRPVECSKGKGSRRNACGGGQVQAARKYGRKAAPESDSFLLFGAKTKPSRMGCMSVAMGELFPTS